MLAACTAGTHIRRMTRLASRLALVVGMLSMSGRVTAQQAAGARPSLVVLITIDQMRGDYLTRFGPQLTGGLGRLMRGGAWKSPGRR